VGGLEKVADVLAEDYTLGALFQDSDLRVSLSPHLLQVITGGASTRQFLNRHMRWAQMRRHIAPWVYALEIMGYPCLFLAALWLIEGMSLSAPQLAAQGVWSLDGLGHLALALGGSWVPWVLLLKWTVDAVVYIALAARPSLRTLLLLPVKDALMPVIWVVGGLRRTVNWRGQRLWVSAGSRLSVLPQRRPVGREDNRWATPVI